MDLSRLLPLFRELPTYTQLVEQLSTTKGEHRATMLDAAKPYFIAALHEDLGLPLMVVTAQPENTRRLYEQLQVWCSSSANLCRFPEVGSPHSSSASAGLERLQVLAVLALSEPFASCHSERVSRSPEQSEGEESHTAQGKPCSERSESIREESRCPMAGMNPATTFGVAVKRPPLIVSSALAIMTKIAPQRDFASACHVLKQGMTADLIDLLHKWQNMGYEMEDVVEVPGQMSKRGGIIDVFPICSSSPVRIEFLGNQIESMRLFDPESQCSTTPIRSITITPAKELFIGGTIFDYLGDNALLILDDIEEIKAVIQRLDAQSQELRNSELERGSQKSQKSKKSGVMGDSGLWTLGSQLWLRASAHRNDTVGSRDKLGEEFLAWEELEPKIRARHRLMLKSASETLRFAQGDKGSAQGDTIESNVGLLRFARNHIALPFTPSQSYGGKLGKFLKAAKQMIQQRQRVLIVSHQANRLAELLHEEGIHTHPTSQVEQAPPPGSITLLQGSLAAGWQLLNVLNLITDAELFGFVKQARSSRKMPVRRSLLLPQLMPEDYVVHVDHGIGRFNGLTKMSTDGIEREYLVLEYAGSDRLYVPTEQIERVSRYIGSGDQAPILSRLGTQEWQRTKEKVKQSVVDSAQELLDLYAAREVTPGFAFPPDTLWQQELEASFPYMETPDQLEAIMAVKEDMERLKPMDRLICGDVGYGKTEVALRAAFKAVMDNKQVAILAPTTVLAQQHLATFSERLQTFPLRVEMLSRFCPPEKEGKILEDLVNGTVDICIGTHRLLQKDIAFKDLGLVIIDEEQQFGVAQKERLKQVRREVDTIALSATPIPRTLHMSLTGIRDISIMETPPEERLSIKTYVGVYDDTLVRQAVLCELERNGQVFFVHNRVQSIALVASKLQALVPEARIAIAHGQMPEEELGKVMADFIAGTYDVLVTTTIIQLGLDMPNVNTLIVDQADKFGLAQLYQLRGRIGRGINQAFAYFLYDKGKQLTSQAHKRLRTIFEATELGAGFGIAMKDLEIRGAGNLLGVKQSGHIAAIGFDLYCQMLAETVEEVKAVGSQRSRESGGTLDSGLSTIWINDGRGISEGEIGKKEAKQSPSISLPLTAHISEEYVPNLNTRLSLYRRLAAIERVEEVKDIAQELRDRFGALPEPVKNLLYIVKTRVLASKAEVSSIFTQGKQIVIKPKEPLAMSPSLTLSLRAEALSQSCEPKAWQAAKGQRSNLTARSYSGAIKIGATQIKLDTKHPGIEWTKALEEILWSITHPST